MKTEVRICVPNTHGQYCESYGNEMESLQEQSPEFVIAGILILFSAAKKL